MWLVIVCTLKNNIGITISWLIVKKQFFFFNLLWIYEWTVKFSKLASGLVCLFLVWIEVRSNLFLGLGDLNKQQMHDKL